MAHVRCKPSRRSWSFGLWKRNPRRCSAPGATHRWAGWSVAEMVACPLLAHFLERQGMRSAGLPGGVGSSFCAARTACGVCLGVSGAVYNTCADLAPWITVIQKKKRFRHWRKLMTAGGGKLKERLAIMEWQREKGVETVGVQRKIKACVTATAQCVP